MIGSGITIGLVSWANFQDVVQGLVAIILVLIFALSPVWFGLVMYANKGNLTHPSIQKKIGSMYLGVWLSTGWGLSYSIVFLIRRSLFVALTFALYDYPGIQIQLFIYSSVLYMIYLHA